MPQEADANGVYNVDGMKIFVTGGTGFVGRTLVARLVRAEPRASLRLLARSARSIDALGDLADHVEPVYGDIFSPDLLVEGMAGCDAVIHLVGIIREVGEQTFERVHDQGTRNVVNASVQAGVARFLHMSAENSRPDAPDRYHTTKYQAEEFLRNSSLDWTILRPSMLFGKEDKNFNELARIIRRAPCVPVVGDGEYIWQPVSVEDVAEIFVQALFSNQAVGKTYEIRGPERFTFNEILDLLMRVLGRERPKIHVPVSLMEPMVSFMNLAPSVAPLTREQMKMLLDRTEPPPENFSHDFPIRLTRLEEGLRAYLS